MASAAPQNSVPPVSGATFRPLLAWLAPQASELRWKAVPWQTDLRAACQLASEQGKPVFLWAMNGNPLGCT